MLYALINKEKGEIAGVSRHTHNVYGNKMVVNENELKKINEDFGVAATILGGVVMDFSEISAWIRKNK